MSGDFLNVIQFDWKNRLCWGNFWVKGNRKHRPFIHPSSQKDMYSVKENLIPCHCSPFLQAGKKTTLSVIRLTECLDTKSLAVSKSWQIKSSCPECGEFEVLGKWQLPLSWRTKPPKPLEVREYSLTYLEKGAVAGPRWLTLQTLQINTKDLPWSCNAIQGKKFYLCLYRLSFNNYSFDHKFYPTYTES